MSRRRYISTDISTDTKIAELAEYGSLPLLLYTWAIPHMDDWGRMSGDPRQFKLLVCPALDVTAAEVEKALDQIAAVGLWKRYQVNERWYLAIPKDNWFKYQTYINKKKQEDDSKSKFPAPPKDDGQELPENTEGCQQTPQNAEEQQATTQKAVSPSPSPSPSPIDDDDDNARARAIPTTDNYVKTYEQEFGRLISPSEMDLLQSYVDDGMEQSVVCEAIRRTRISGKTDLRYTKSILNNWLDNGVKNMAGVARADMEFEQRKNKGGIGCGRDSPNASGRNKGASTKTGGRKTAKDYTSGKYGKFFEEDLPANDGTV